MVALHCELLRVLKHLAAERAEGLATPRNTSMQGVGTKLGTIDLRSIKVSIDNRELLDSASTLLRICTIENDRLFAELFPFSSQAEILATEDGPANNHLKQQHHANCD